MTNKKTIRKSSPKTSPANEKYFIPMEVTTDTIRDFGINRTDIVAAKIGNKIIRAIMVPCTKEQYHAFMRPIWAEEKRVERNRRCTIPNGHGKTKRCDGDCSKCEKMKTGSTISIEEMKDDAGKEVPEPITDASSIALTAMLFNDLMKKLQEQDPQLAEIFSLLFDGESQRSIAKITGIKAQSSVESKISRIRRILQRHVSREDITG